MSIIIAMLYNGIWKTYTAKRWGQEAVVTLFKKGDTADPEDRCGITLRSTAKKTLRKIANDGGETMLDMKDDIREGKQGLDQTVLVQITCTYEVRFSKIGKTRS